MAIGSAPARAASIATASAVPPGPWAYRPTGTPEASRSRPMRSPAAAGSSAPAGSCSSTRSAPSSREPACPLDEAAASRRIAVHEPGIHERSGLAHGRDRADEIVDVVQRIVQAEDVDSRLRSTQDETAHEIGVGRARADEERSPQRHHERRRRACLERADPLPRALHCPLHGSGEAAAAGHLERGVPRAVEVLGEAQDVRGRDAPDERLLRQEPDRRIDEASHVRAQARDR